MTLGEGVTWGEGIPLASQTNSMSVPFVVSMSCALVMMGLVSVLSKLGMVWIWCGWVVAGLWLDEEGTRVRLKTPAVAND